METSINDDVTVFAEEFTEVMNRCGGYGCKLPNCKYHAVSCMGCGYPLNSFACKIRHIQINTGEAKAAND